MTDSEFKFPLMKETDILLLERTQTLNGKTVNFLTAANHNSISRGAAAALAGRESFLLSWQKVLGCAPLGTKAYFLEQISVSPYMRRNPYMRRTPLQPNYGSNSHVNIR